MIFKFDKNGKPVISKIYACDLCGRPTTPLNGIISESCSLDKKYNNTKTITFSVDKYVTNHGKRRLSNHYEYLDTFMKIAVENTGWFVINNPPTVSGDGYNEIKTITAESDEIEFVRHDLVGFKVNCGTTDSVEMLIKDNVIDVDGVEFAKEQIKFYREDKPELSLLHIALNESGNKDWNIGYIDDIPKLYKEYTEDEELIEKQVLLKDEIGYFDIGSQNIYAFLTQDIEKFFECIVEFDIRHHVINVYRIENVGKDTNIIIANRNLQTTREISVDEDSIYTRYRVSGSDSLGVEFVNYGSNIIENISYFLTLKYMPLDLIEKYKEWYAFYNDNRKTFSNLTLSYNKQLDICSELKDRVPRDECSTDWFKMSDDELKKQRDRFEAVILGYESFYVDSEGDFDIEALKRSSDANDYFQIKDVILPSIKIEMDDRDISDKEDHADYIKSYETDWKLYGLDELQLKLDGYKEDNKVLEVNGYNVPWDETSKHSKDYHSKCYERYLSNSNQLNEDYIDSCAMYLKERESEYDNATVTLNRIASDRQTLSKSVLKENWIDSNGFPFEDRELFLLSKLYTDTDYVNNNIFISDNDSQYSIISEQWKLLNAAEEDLSFKSKPQYQYQTNIDNLLAIPQYQNILEHLELGNFIRLEVYDNFFVKVRLITMSYNPLLLENDLSITFSSFVSAGATRNDLASLLNSNSYDSKNSITGNSLGNNFIKDSSERLSNEILQKVIASTAFNNRIKNIVTNMIMEVN